MDKINSIIFGRGRGRGKPPPTLVPNVEISPKNAFTPGTFGIGRSSIRRLATNPVFQPGRSGESLEVKVLHDIYSEDETKKLVEDQPKEIKSSDIDVTTEDEKTYLSEDYSEGANNGGMLKNKKRKYSKTKNCVREPFGSISTTSDLKANDEANPLTLIQVIKNCRITKILRRSHSTVYSTSSNSEEIEKIKLAIAEDKIFKHEINTEKKKKSDYLFSKIKKIGSGLSGVVYQVRDNLGNDFAMKVIREDKVGKNNMLHELMTLETLRELRCEDFNCIQMLNFYEMENFLFIQFPLYGPTLDKRITIFNESKEILVRSFQVRQITEILSQLICALKFLHRHHIAHFDLKPNNIIFIQGDWYPEKDPDSGSDSVKMVNTQIRLIDFGLSLSHPENRRRLKNVCILRYRPPESILGRKIGYPVDIWGCGLIGLAMYFGHHFFEGPKTLELLAQMENVLGLFPPNLLQGKEAVKYFRRNKTKRPSNFNRKSLKKYRPLNNMKKTTTSSETDKLFALFEKMLKLDSYERATSEQLWQMIKLL